MQNQVVLECCKANNVKTLLLTTTTYNCMGPETDLKNEVEVFDETVWSDVYEIEEIDYYLKAKWIIEDDFHMYWQEEERNED